MQVRSAQQGFGSQVIPEPIQASWQPAWVVIVQLPVAAQQAPVGCTQGLGVQVAPMVQVPVHCSRVVTAQEPSGWQQDPEGCGHGFGWQILPRVHVPVHWACSVTVQLPSGWQHTPVG